MADQQMLPAGPSDAETLVPVRALPSVQLPRATHSGVLFPGQAHIPCYVLSDGTRLLLLAGIVKAIGMRWAGSNRQGLSRISEFIAGNRIKPFVSVELENLVSTPRPFITPQGQVARGGYEATVLVDLCEAILQARAAGEKLTPHQVRIAQSAEVLMRAFARVGIIALVDEATGYQSDRPRDELHRLLERFLSPLYATWSKRFPDVFFQELFRLRGWPHDFRKGPRQVGNDIKDIVYKRLHPDVLATLETLNPVVGERRRVKHHPYLTSDIGQPVLREHLARVITLMQVSRTWPEFLMFLDRICPVPQSRALTPAIYADVATVERAQGGLFVDATDV